MNTATHRAWRIALVVAALAVAMPSSPVRAEGPKPAGSPTTAEAVSAALDRFEELRQDAQRLERAAEHATGDTHRILVGRWEKKTSESVALVHDAARTILAEVQEAGVPTELLQKLHDAFEPSGAAIRATVARAVADWSSTSVEDTDLSPAQESERLERRRVIVDRLDHGYRSQVTHLQLAEALGLDVTAEWEQLRAQLVDTAETSSVFLELARERASTLAGRLQANPADDDVRVRLGIAGKRIEYAAHHLRALTGLMADLGFDISEHEKHIIIATGELDTAVLNLGVFEAVLAESWHHSVAWLEEQGLTLLFKIILVLLIIFVSWAVARFTGHLVGRAFASGRLEASQLLQRIALAWVRRVVLLLGVLVALGQIGVSIGPLLAGLGVAGFIIGFALQDTLSNFASGVFILAYRPYDVGDVVEAGGVVGKVGDMSLVTTTIRTPDNQRIVVPNSKIWGNVIKNVTAETTRRVDLVFGISYADDIARAEEILDEILRAHPKVLDDPAPVVKLHELADSSVDFVARPWVATADYWDVHWDITREVKLRFDREGISIPFPQCDVHLVGGTAQTVAGATGTSD